MLDGQPHGVILVIAGNLLDEGAIVFKEHEVAQIVQQVRGREQTAHERLELVELPQGVKLYAINRAPLHEALGIGGQRPIPGFATVGDDQNLVVFEDVWNLCFVCLNLVVGFPDVGILIDIVLQLNQH